MEALSWIDNIFGLAALLVGIAGPIAVIYILITHKEEGVNYIIDEKFDRGEVVIPSLVLVGVIALAIPNLMPEWYFLVLRWAVLLWTFKLTLMLYDINKGWMILYGSLILLFNPFFPVYLGKGLWVIMDIIAIIIYSLGALYIRKYKVVA